MDDSELRSIEERNVEASREAFVKEWDEEEEQASKDYSQYIVDIHGKQYMTVAGRIKAFWDRAHEYNLSDSNISTEITLQGNTVLCKAKVCLWGKMKATGHASEVIGDSNINKTSALENAETSAIGRALGNLGIGLLEAGGVASADEVQNALKQQSSFASKLATQKQKDFLTTLTKEKKGGAPKPEWLNALTIEEAKKHIDTLLKMKPVESGYNDPVENYE